MSELCLTIDEQLAVSKLIASNVSTAAKFMENLNENNVTKFEQEYIRLVLQCRDEAYELRPLLQKMTDNINKWDSNE